MKKIVILGFLMLAACDPVVQAQESANEATYKRIEAEIAKRGYALVGTTPDGKPLYMKKISVGFATDRVYFTDGSRASTISHSYCGKNCEKTTVTIQ